MGFGHESRSTVGRQNKETDMSDMIKVTPSTARLMIMMYFKSGVVPFVWGSPGIGKSEMYHQIAEALNCELLDVRALLYDPVDIRGIPIPNEDLGRIEWWLPAFLPQPGCPDTLMLLEELNAAPQSVQAAFYQLTLDRKLGDYVLSDNVLIACAGNLETDRSVVHKMPTALANRLGHIEMIPDVDDLVAWGNTQDENGVHNLRPEICAFLRFRRELIHDMSGYQQSKAFPSPRMWKKLSDVQNERPEEKIEHALYSGLVGQGAAAEYIGYLQVYRQIPDLKRIIDEPGKAPVPDEPNVMWAVVTGLSRMVDEDPKRFAPCAEYIDRLPNSFKDFGVVFMRDVLAKHRHLVTTKEFVKWGQKNTGVVLGD